MSLQKIKDAIHKFEELQEELSESGASDTEPDTVFQTVLVLAVKGMDYLPKTVDDWQLYEGSSKAAAKLTRAADKIRKLIQATMIKESAELQRYIKDYCWRRDYDSD